MNIYEKLLKARLTLQQTDIKKSGHNKNLGFKYMELDDFLPRVNEINDELKLFTMFSITSERATCTLINAEKPEEQIIFESHIAHAKLQGGAAPIQELGSQHTYMRRYLYLMVYEISENDTLDPELGKDKKEKQQPTDKITTQQLIDMAKSKNITEKGLINRYKADTGKDVQEVKFIPADVKLKYYNAMKELVVDEKA